MARFCHHGEAQIDAVIADSLDALHLDRLDDLRAEFRILQQFGTDDFHQLFDLGDIRVVADRNKEFVDDPVTAHVLHGT